jgi:hypothetical protein
MGWFRCQACHEFIFDDDAYDWAGEKWQEELTSRGYTSEDEDNLPEQPHNYLGSLDRCPNCIEKGACARPYCPPPRPPTVRFECVDCKRTATKHSATCYAKLVWEEEERYQAYARYERDVRRYPYDGPRPSTVPEHRIDLTTCPRCLRRNPVVVPCAGVEGFLIGRGGCNIKALEARFPYHGGMFKGCSGHPSYLDDEYDSHDEDDSDDDEYDDNDDDKEVRFEFEDGNCYVTGHRKAAAARAIAQIVREKMPAAAAFAQEKRRREALEARMAEIRKSAAEAAAAAAAAAAAEEGMDVHVVSSEAAMAVRYAAEEASRIDLTSSPERPDGAHTAEVKTEAPARPRERDVTTDRPGTRVAARRGHDTYIVGTMDANGDNKNMARAAPVVAAAAASDAKGVSAAQIPGVQLPGSPIFETLRRFSRRLSASASAPFTRATLASPSPTPTGPPPSPPLPVPPEHQEAPLPPGASLLPWPPLPPGPPPPSAEPQLQSPTKKRRTDRTDPAAPALTSAREIYVLTTAEGGMLGAFTSKLDAQRRWREYPSGEKPKIHCTMLEECAPA